MDTRKEQHTVVTYNHAEVQTVLVGLAQLDQNKCTLNLVSNMDNQIVFEIRQVEAGE